MNYQIIFEAAAAKQLKKLSKPVQQTLRPLIDSLSTNPRPSGCKKLKGRQGEYRIRSGNYRIIYSIEDKALIVRVIKIGHRKSAYE